MATYERYMNAARNADAAGDEAAARQLVQAAMAARSQTTQEPEVEEEGRELFGSFGEVGGSALAGAARGALGALELPEMALRGVARLGQEGLQAVGLADEDYNIPVLDTFTGRAVDAATEAAGVDELIDYRGDSRAAGLAGTIGEFAAGGGGVGLAGKGLKAAALASGKVTKDPGIVAKTARGIAKGARGIERAGLTRQGQALSAMAATGSETLGQMAEGGELEGFARISGSLLAPSAISKTINVGNKTLNTIRGKNQKVPTIENLYKEKNYAYEQVRKSAQGFSGTDTAYMVENAIETAYARGAVDLTDKAFIKARDLLRKVEGKPMSLNEFDKIQRKLGKIYSRKGKDQPFILDMMKVMDDELAKKAANQDLIKAARSANKKYYKAKLLEDTISKLQNQRKVAGTGGNVANQYRNAMRRIIDNPNKVRFFDKHEVDAMQAIVDGSVPDNILRIASKMAPGGNGLMTYLNVVTFSLNPAFLGITGAAMGSKALLDSRIKLATKRLQDMIKVGGGPEKAIDENTVRQILASQGMLSGLGQE